MRAHSPTPSLLRRGQYPPLQAADCCSTTRRCSAAPYSFPAWQCSASALARNTAAPGPYTAGRIPSFPNATLPFALLGPGRATPAACGLEFPCHGPGPPGSPETKQVHVTSQATVRGALNMRLRGCSPAPQTERTGYERIRTPGAGPQLLLRARALTERASRLTPIWL